LQGDWTRVLGADPVLAVAAVAAPVADARFRLLGVVAPRSPRASGEGVALIAVDGKPPRAYRVGAVVDGEHVLQAVQARSASLGPRGGAAVVALQIPPPQAASTGSLTGAGTAPPKVDAGPANLALPQSPMPLEPEVPVGSPQTR
ncbi:MAG: type II secretion system protein N, partial [Rubrivivax sp.]|nr:type II secretion system protein N [Rubrivivax sp.]